MANSGDRFYQMQFRHREVLHGDVGSLLRIEGLVVGGGGTHAVLLLPEYSIEAGVFPCKVFALAVDAWSDWLQRSDNPEILAGLSKVFQRKVRHEISGAVQQKIWVADKFACVYCGNAMGAVQLTIDHFIPLELGGANNLSNYLSACRRCNKDKGGQHPKDWLLSKGQAQRYLELEYYLKHRVVN